MSTVLISDVERPARRTATYARPRPAAYTRQIVRTRSRRRSSSVLSVFMTKAVALTVVAAAAYGASTLAGQTMMEQARREGLRAQERSRQARMDVGLLRERVARLSSMKTIENWAAMSGMSQERQVKVLPEEPIRVAALH
jgi:hypothetical protein